MAEDPLAAFKSARADIEAVLDDPALAVAEMEAPFIGRVTVAHHIDRVVSEDMVLHGWDLARATGQDERIDPAELARVREAAESMPEEVLRMPGVFGPAVEPPTDADEQTRLLCFLGRRV